MKDFKLLGDNSLEHDSLKETNFDNTELKTDKVFSLSRHKHDKRKKKEIIRGFGIPERITGMGVDDEDVPLPASYPWHKIAPKTTRSLPKKKIDIKPAPMPEKDVEFDWITILGQPLGTLIAYGVVTAIMYMLGNTASYYMILMFAAVAPLTVLWGVLRYRKQKKNAANSSLEWKQKYRQYLSEEEEQLSIISTDQSDIMNEENPPAVFCASFSNSSSDLWSRNFEASSFLSVRLGTGTEPLCVSIKAPEKSYDRENDLEEEARALADKYKNIDDVPVVFQLGDKPTLGIVGPRKDVLSQAVALVVSAAALHSYEDLKIIIVYPKSEATYWEEFRWLPHVYDKKRNLRYFADNKADAVPLIDSFVEEIKLRRESKFEHSYSRTATYPHLLFIIADSSYFSRTQAEYFLCLNDPDISVSSIFLADSIRMLPQNCKWITEVEDGKGRIFCKESSNEAKEYAPDSISAEDAGLFARRLAPIRILGGNEETSIPSYIDFMNGWGVNSPLILPIRDNWEKRSPQKNMSVPLGAVSKNQILAFDIHQNACGAHGIYVGASGSGKSSVIRSWVLSMAVSFPPDKVSFVLVDFKGSGLLHGLEKLPHIAGTISDLDQDIRRNLIALESEISKREDFLRNYRSEILNYLKEVEKAQSTEHPLPFLPFIFVVIDELKDFRSWANANMDNRMQLLDKLYSKGRALGIYVIAGSQTTAPFTESMEKNANFRWCLKTATPQDSVALLKNDDAFKIVDKGRAILRVGDNEIYEEFQPFFSDGPYLSPEEKNMHPETEMAIVRLGGQRKSLQLQEIDGRETQLETIVSAVCDCAKSMGYPEAYKVWPDRLPSQLYLSELGQPNPNSLTAIVGKIDDPFAQRQYPMTIDLPSNGHVIVYAAPRMGKSTFLQTASLSLLTNNSCDTADFYLIGADLDCFASFPQVRSVSDQFSAEKTILRLNSELTRRKQSKNSDSYKKIVLIVDGIDAIPSSQKTFFKELVVSGEGCGMYLLASANHVNGTSSIQQYLKTGIALWFSPNVYDYRTALSRKDVEFIPNSNIKGRAIIFRDRTLDAQIALPYRLQPGQDLDQEIEAIGNKLSKSIDGRVICEDSASASPDDYYIGEGKAVIGYDVVSTRPVYHDFGSFPYLLVINSNVEQRHKQMKDISRQLLQNQAKDIKEIIGVDIDVKQWTSMQDARTFPSGVELDNYLESLKNDFEERNEAYKSGKGAKQSKYIFVIGDLALFLQNSSQLSIQRLSVNLLLKASVLGIQLVVGCEPNAFDSYYINEENRMRTGEELGPTLRLGTSNCLMRLTEGQRPPAPFLHQFKQEKSDSGTYYVTAETATEIELLSV